MVSSCFGLVFWVLEPVGGASALSSCLVLGGAGDPDSEFVTCESEVSDADADIVDCFDQFD